MIKQMLVLLKSEIRILTGIRWLVLISVAYSVVLLYKFFTNTFDAANSTISFWGMLFIVIVVFTVSIIWDTIVGRRQSQSNELRQICLSCLRRRIERELKLHAYDLISIADLISEIEENLEAHDEVIIYTSHDETEADISKVVEKNVEKGVRYNLLYYNDIDATKPEQKYYERNIDLSKTKYNSGIDSEFSKDIGFDIFIVKYHKSNKCEAYFAVNYSVGEKRCAVETFSDCNNPCDKSNEHLFYKRTNDDIASAIYERLRRVVATVGNDGEQ